jgi:hypothetical protein
MPDCNLPSVGPSERLPAPVASTLNRVIGLDCHPDTFTAAVFKGSTPHDARKLSSVS